jgi:hypothetical protein
MPYSLTLLDDKITTVSGELTAQIPSLVGYATEDYVSSNYIDYVEMTTISGDLVAQMGIGNVTEEQLTTTSGDIVNQIPSLVGYSTEGWVSVQLNTTSGNLTQYIDYSLTTVSATLVLYSDTQDSLKADISYVDSKFLTTSGSIINYVDSQNNAQTINMLGILTTTSGDILGWVQDSYFDSSQVTTISGDIVSQIPSLAGYATELWVEGRFTTVSGDIVAQIPSLVGYATEVYVSDNYIDNSELTTTSGDIVSQIPSLSGYATEVWVGNQDYSTQSELTTASGDIVSQIPSLVGYATELWTTDLVDTTSGSLTNYMDTISGSLRQYASRSPMLVDVGPYSQYTTIQSAIDSITVEDYDYDWYIVRIFPGTYYEDVLMKDNVDVLGLNYNCVIEGSVSWPADRCTEGRWSSLHNLAVTAYPTASGVFNMLHSEAGKHDLVNSWFYMQVDVDGPEVTYLDIQGGNFHSYLSEWEIWLNNPGVEGVTQRGIAVTSGTYVEISGDFLCNMASDYGDFISYSVVANNPGNLIDLIGGRIHINSTTNYFNGNITAVKTGCEGESFRIQNTAVDVVATQGGIARYASVDSAEIGSSSATLLSHANRINISGFDFSYSCYCAGDTDLWVSHFDSINAQDGVVASPESTAVVHSDAYGELHLNKFIEFSPTTTSGVDRDLLVVDIGGSTNPVLRFQETTNPRLMWKNPDGYAGFTAESILGNANLGAAVVGDTAFDYDAMLTIRQDTDISVSGINRWRIKSEGATRDLVIDHYSTILSAEGTPVMFRQTDQGLTSLRYGIPVDRFLNESDMASYSQYALPTQKSVVDYVDTVSGSLYDRFAGEYATQEDLTTTSGDIMDYIYNQGAATIPYVGTVSGTLHEEIVTTSGAWHQEIIIAQNQFTEYVNAYIKPYRYLSVSVSGGDFQSIQAAIDSITITDFDTEFWAIQVHPGIYYEDVYPKDNVDILGDSYDACIIEGSVNWLAASGCNADYWSALQNLTIQANTTASGFCTICCDAGNHDIVNAYVWLTTEGVGGNCVLMEGGSIASYLTMYEYSHTGDTSSDTEDNHRCVRGLGGSFTSQSDSYVMDIEDSTPGRTVTFITQRSFDSSDKTVIVSANMDMTLASGFAGTVQGFRIRGGSNVNSVNGTKMHIQSLGGGTAYGYYVDSQEVGALTSRVYSTANRVTLLGFDTDYFAHVGTQDYFGSHFDDIICTNGVQGNTSTYQMVSSEIDGQLRVTDHLKIGRGSTADQRLIEVDVGEGDNNPSVVFGSDYFGYIMQSFVAASGSVANVTYSPEGPVLMGSMSYGPNPFGYEQRLSVWAHETDNGTPLGYERRGYRMKRKTDESFAISRHWTYEDGGVFVDLLNIDPWGGLRLRNSDVRVSAIYDEDDFASNSASGIATQQSTKIYIENELTTASGYIIDLLSSNGFVYPNTGTISFNNSTREFTVSGTYQIISGNQLYDKAGGQLTISDDEGVHYIYYHDGELISTLSPFSIMADAPVATIYWDKDNQKSILFAYEQHNTLMDDSTHLYLHLNRGMQWYTGLSLVHNATTSGSPNVDNRNTWVGLSSGTILDEDIFCNITNVSGTSTVLWAQDLGDIQIDTPPTRSSKLPVFYTLTSGTVLWRKQDPSDFPFIYDGSDYPLVNTNDSGWSLSQFTSGFMVLWVYGTLDVDNPISILGHPYTYTSLVDAQASTTAEVFEGRANKPSYEMRALHRLIYEVDAGYSASCKHAILRSVSDYRVSEAVSVNTSAAVSLHSGLSDLNSSGHPATVITVDALPNFLSGYSNAQTALQRIDSYIPATYSTKNELTSTSGYIIGYIDAQDYAQNAAVSSQITTTSGDLKGYTNGLVTTTSGDLKNYIDSVAGAQTHGALNGLDADDHPQYTQWSQDETVSGNWTINTKLGFSNYVNSSPADGERWRQSDHDFRARQNSNTFVDAMNSMCQIRQAAGISPQDCNTSAGVAITWNAQDVVDGLYGHSTSTNPSRVTVSGTAWYKINYGVSHINQSNQRKNIATQLRKNGTTLLVPGKAHAISYNTTDAYATNTSASIHRLVAGDYIEVVASGTGSVGSANTAQEGGCWLSVEFVRWSN